MFSTDPLCLCDQLESQPLFAPTLQLYTEELLEKSMTGVSSKLDLVWLCDDFVILWSSMKRFDS